MTEEEILNEANIRKQNEGLWIARERSGNLFVFTSKPKLNGIWVRASEPYGSWVQIPSELYPEVTFENSPKKLRV